MKRNARTSPLGKWRDLRDWTMAAAVAVLLTLLTTTSLRAGTITVTDLPPTGTDAATGITTNKTYVCAFNYGSQNATIYSVNGVPFAHFRTAANNVYLVTNWVDSVHGGQVIVSTAVTNKGIDVTSSSGQGGLANQADGTMFSLLTDLMYPGNGAPIGGWLQQEYDNLTIGHQYSLRLYYRYWGNAIGDRTQIVSVNGEGTWQAYSGNPLDEDRGTNVVTGCHGARYLQYDFTATATNVFCLMSNLVANGAAMVEAATLEDASVPFAPFITFQPNAVAVGTPTVFTVSAIGTGPLAYQWYHSAVSNYTGAAMATDGTDYSGSTTTNLFATNNILDYYFVVVTNNYGSVTSSITQINPKPTITAQPAISANVGVSVVYSMSAGGFPPLAYQWYFNTASNYSGATAANGNGYSGSTTNILTATTNLQDYYFVIVTNNYGSVTSAIAAYNPLPTIVAQPSPFKVGSSVGFNVTGGGWPTLGYQWYLNTVSNYSGATLMSDGSGVSGSTTASVTIANLTDYYFVVVTNYYGSVTSQVAQVAGQLTVTSAGEPIWNQTSQTNVIVTFSDVLDAATATTAVNYLLDNGASVLSAAMGGSNEVVLATSILTPGTSYTLTIQNVKDYYGIPMSPSPTNFAVGIYPANLALWVRADTGVTTDAGTNTVNQWNDLSVNGNNLSQVLGPPFEPQLATNGSGDPVIRFTATNETFMQAASTPSLAITGDMSIIAVVNFATLDGGTNGEIVSKTGASSKNIAAPYDYYVIATNTGARFYRGNGSAFGQVTASQAPSLGTPHILTVTETGNTVSHFLDGAASGTGILNNSFNETSATDAGQPLSIGIRGDAINRLAGDLSELIIAGSPISSYDVASLNKYLITQHHLVFVNTTPTNIVISVTGNQITLSWPADHIGWQLQSNSVGLTATGAWFTVPGSTATDQIITTLDATKTNVFYRMYYQP
jgi:hypothetical protein